MILVLLVVLFAQNPEQIFQSALDAQQRGDFAQAVTGYRKVLQLEPGLIPAQANLGASLSGLGRYDEAIVQYAAALKQEPSNAALRLNLALAYFKKSDYPNASDHLKILHLENPAEVRVATLYGDTLARLGKTDQAFAVLAPLEQSRPDDPDVAFALGNALVRSGKKRDGVQRIEKAAKGLNNPEAYRVAAETWFDLSDFVAARGDIENAAAINPSLPGLDTIRGMVEQALGDRQTAAVTLGKALKANPNDFRAHLYLGALLFTERNLKESRTHLDKALQLEPTSAMARYELALVQRATGQNDAAVKNLEQVIRGNPKWLQVHVELAALYYRVNRPEDGQRERKIVQQLAEEQQQQEVRIP